MLIKSTGISSVPTVVRRSGFGLCVRQVGGLSQQGRQFMRKPYPKP